MISACERDDICAANTPTTPVLQIAFFDANNRSNSKLTNVNIREVNSDRIISYGGDTLISVPLRTDTTTTTYIFTKNPGLDEAEEDPDASDQISFTYSINEIYIERACGFKVNYSGLTVQATPGEDTIPWITSANVNENNVINDSTYHVSIFH